MDFDQMPAEELDRYFLRGPPAGETRDQIVQHFLSLVRAVARKIKSRLPPSVDLDDLVSAGTVGLLAAVDRYTPQAEGDFRRYAAIRIRGAILDELRALDWAPRSQRHGQAILREAEHEITGQLGRKATEDEVAAGLGMSLDDYRMMRHRMSPRLLVHIEDIGGSREGSRSAWEILQDPDAVDPAVLTQVRNSYAAIVEGVAALPERERLVISLFYFEQFLAKDIARILNVTEGRVSQIHHAALERLQKRLTTLPFSPAAS